MHEIQFRPYTPQDVPAVCDFLAALNQTDHSHIHWNWARYEWMAFHPEFDRASEGAMGLWTRDGRVVAAALYDMYFGEAFCGVLPTDQELFPQVLAYAWEALKDENGLGISLWDGNEREIAAAKAAGFLPADQTETVLSLDLEKLPSRPLPAGYALREMDQVADFPALEWLFWQGFDHGDDRALFEREGRSEPRPRPHCSKALSLAAVTPAGEPVAFSGVWYLPGTDYAYVEPVCTVPAHRGKGLAGAVLTQGLSRAKAMGAQKAFVISELAFYRDLGFDLDHHFTFYWKKP